LVFIISITKGQLYIGMILDAISIKSLGWYHRDSQSSVTN